MYLHRYVIHAIPCDEYKKEKEAGYIGKTSLERFGFIHCSDIDTYSLVAPNFRYDDNERYILVIDAEKLTSEIKWEDGGGWDFPHIYGLIDEAAAVEVLPHLWSADRVWVPNEELDKYREV